MLRNPAYPGLRTLRQPRNGGSAGSAKTIGGSVRRSRRKHRRDSPAWKLGFQPIPLDKIGLYRDELRAALPGSKPRPAD
jgi:hypothetical protein